VINLCQCSTAFGIDARNLNIALMQPEMEDHMEALGNIGALVGGLGVLVSAIFVGVQIRVANKLARADSQRHTRHAWQEALFYMSDNGKAVRKFLHNYEETGPDDQFKAAHALIAMGNHLDLLLKLESEGLESQDNIRFMSDAFVGLVSTRGGIKFWTDMASIELFGDDLLKHVESRLSMITVPNNDLSNILPWLRPDNDWPTN